jgi:prolyl 4-hydroxylase
VFLYLNDVEAGGGTKFNDLNITVMPKRGRALLWPSVHNDEPNLKDERTKHEALPVEAGVKYGANAWFHQFDVSRLALCFGGLLNLATLSLSWCNVAS